MSLKLSHNNTPAYDFVSEETELNPISATVTLDASGGTEDSTTITAYLVAETLNYTGITVTPVNETDTGVDWKVSTDNVTFLDAVTPADMDATGADVVTTLYFKAVVTDNGTVPTANYTACNINVTATENPA